MDQAKGLIEKGKTLAAEHPDKVNEAIDKAGDLADDKTGGKFADKVDSAQDAAKKGLGTA
jgi:hypothetical protein